MQLNRKRASTISIRGWAPSWLVVVGASLVIVAGCAGQEQPGGAAGQQTAKPQVAQATATLAPGAPTQAVPAAVAAATPTAAPSGPSAPTIAPSSPTLAAPAPAATQPTSIASVRWTFDSDAPGSLPTGAQVFSGMWAVRAEAGAPSPPNALCQTGQAEFPALSLDSKSVADLTLTARFKPISGQEDQAGGLLFRIQDKDNYYILRANALENNVNFYKYAGGRRTGLTNGRATVPSGAWHELRVEVKGTGFRGFFNGQQVVEATDESYKTGGVGLWTKADSVTCFDDVELRPT
jgi:hypothetical protein